jgi:hypothetical protein
MSSINTPATTLQAPSAANRSARNSNLFTRRVSVGEPKKVRKEAEKISKEAAIAPA